MLESTVVDSNSEILIVLEFTPAACCPTAHQKITRFQAFAATTVQQHRFTTVIFGSSDTLRENNMLNDGELSSSMCALLL